MIQRRESVNEKVNYMRTIRPFTDGERVTMSGDNIFESLATTNPEAFDNAKLEAILESKDIVNEFNRYLMAIISNDFDRFYALLKEYEGKKSQEDYKKFNNELYKDFNILNVGVFREDIDYLRGFFENDKDVLKVLFSTYLPDGLTEAGVKRLIRTRLANDKFITDNLMRMMENNYELFNINSCEAQGLINGLKDNSTKSDSIASIRNMFKDPKILENFKDDRGNYDFRPIGGAYLIMRDKLEWQGAAPAKYLQNLFKYDCVVYTHGGYDQNQRSKSILGTMLTSSSFIAKDIYDVLKYMETHEKFTKYSDEKVKKQLEWTLDEVYQIATSMFISLDRLDYIYDLLKKLNESMIDLAHRTDSTEVADYMYAFIGLVDNFMQPISDKHNIIRNKIDGSSSDWTIQPVNSLTQKNVTHVIDLLRALKKEGFKNILIMSCNPGSVKLPPDIKISPTFNVTMGNHSVMIEALTAGNDYQNMQYLNEGLLTSIKLTFMSAKRSMQDFFSKCRTRFNEITKNISKHIDSRFKNKKFEKTKVSVMSFDGKKSKYDEVEVKNANEFKKVLETSNNSIMSQIQTISDNQKKFLDQANVKYRIDGNSSFDESVYPTAEEKNNTTALNEFFIMNKLAPDEFFDTAASTLKSFADEIAKFPTGDNTHRVAASSIKIADDADFKKSLDKALDLIERRKKTTRGRDRCQFSSFVDIHSLAWDINYNDLINNTFSKIFDAGFNIMRPNKSMFKDATQRKYFHKALSDRSIMIAEFYIGYAYDYSGYFAGYTNLYMTFYSIENNAKNLKDLNILESVEDNLENVDILTEGFNYSKKPENEFYNITKKLLDGFANDIGELKQRDTLTKVNKKVKEDIWFKKSVESAYKNFDKKKSKSKHTIRGDFNLNSINMNSEESKLFNCIAKNITSNGFVYMKKNKSKIKDFFQTKYYYKEISDKTIVLLLASAYRVTNQYGAVLHIGFEFVASSVENNEKSLKKLNLLEAVNMNNEFLSSINIL